MYLRFILHISIILWKKYNTITIYRLLFYFPSIVSYFRILTNIFVSIARKRRKGRKANTNEIEITVNRRRIRFSNFPERKQLQSPFVRNHRHDWQLIFSVEIANDSIGPIPSIAQTTRSINSNPPPPLPKINSRRISFHPPSPLETKSRIEGESRCGDKHLLKTLLISPPPPSFEDWIFVSRWSRQWPRIFEL